MNALCMVGMPKEGYIDSNTWREDGGKYMGIDVRSREIIIGTRQLLDYAIV